MHEKGKKRAKRIFGLLSAKNVFRKLLILKRNLVGASGFEPPTSWSRTRRSSQAEPRPDVQKNTPRQSPPKGTSLVYHLLRFADFDPATDHGPENLPRRDPHHPHRSQQPRRQQR